MFNFKKHMEQETIMKTLKNINGGLENSRMYDLEIKAKLPDNVHKFINYYGKVFAFDDYFSMGYVSEGAAYQPKFICGSLIPSISGELSIPIDEGTLYKFTFSRLNVAESESKCVGDIFQVYGLGDLKIGTCEVRFFQPKMTGPDTERNSILNTIGIAASKFFGDDSSDFASNYFKNISMMDDNARCRLLDAIYAQGEKKYSNHVNTFNIDDSSSSNFGNNTKS